MRRIDVGVAHKAKQPMAAFRHVFDDAKLGLVPMKLHASLRFDAACLGQGGDLSPQGGDRLPGDANGRRERQDYGQTLRRLGVHKKPKAAQNPDDDSVEPQSEPRHSEAARAHHGFRDQSFRVIGCGSIHVIC